MFDEYGYRWRLELPVSLRREPPSIAEEWLSELWEMRGRIIYDNGLRPEFRREDFLD